MSLSHTAELAKANPFEYVTKLQKHADEVKRNPSRCMAWTYHETVGTVENHPASQPSK